MDTAPIFERALENFFYSEAEYEFPALASMRYDKDYYESLLKLKEPLVELAVKNLQSNKPLMAIEYEKIVTVMKGSQPTIKNLVKLVGACNIPKLETWKYIFTIVENGKIICCVLTEEQGVNFFKKLIAVLEDAKKQARLAVTEDFCENFCCGKPYRISGVNWSLELLPKENGDLVVGVSIDQDYGITFTYETKPCPYSDRKAAIADAIEYLLGHADAAKMK